MVEQTKLTKEVANAHYMTSINNKKFKLKDIETVN